MSEQRERILAALKCCRHDLCENCPIQLDICDTLYVETDVIPTDLLDLIEKELSDESIIERNHMIS